ncbi:MAG: dephospho-CoA kinase [Janthinobacterium lividum]
MPIIAITGSIASGKTLVLDYFARQNYQIFSADRFIKNLYKDRAIQDEVLKKILELKIFDKQKIAEIIYENEARRKAIEQLIHPYVVDELVKIKNNIVNNRVVFAEIPLLFEAKLEKYFEYIIVTTSSYRKRLKRASLRPFFCQEIFDKIEKIQWPQSKKVRRANFVINTDVEMIELQLQLTNILEEIRCRH